MSQSAHKLLESGFTKACAVDEIPQMMPRKVDVDGRSVLLCREAGEVWAVDEICPHKQRSMAYGVVFGGKITCPHHQYEFDLDTGRCNRRRCAPVMTYEVEVFEDTVYVRVG